MELVEHITPIQFTEEFMISFNKAYREHQRKLRDISIKKTPKQEITKYPSADDIFNDLFEKIELPNKYTMDRPKYNKIKNNLTIPLSVLWSKVKLSKYYINREPFYDYVINLYNIPPNTTKSHSPIKVVGVKIKEVIPDYAEETEYNEEPTYIDLQDMFGKKRISI